MKQSKLGKPLCNRCRRLATHKGLFYRSFGKLSHLYFCTLHAKDVYDSVLLQEQDTQGAS